MRVVYLTPGVFDKGGISRYNRYQITALRELVGAKNVKVISLLGPTGSPRDLEEPFNVDWYGQPHARGIHRKAAFIWAATRTVLSFRPSVIWSGHMYYSALALALGRLVGAKTVVQIYGTEAWTPRPERPDIPWAFKRCNYVVADAHFTANYVEEVGLRPKGTTHVMWDPVDVNRFAPAVPSEEVLNKYKIPSPERSFNILTLGRLGIAVVYKGYLRLLEVFPHLPPEAHLIYGGGGDLIPVLEKRAEELGVRERVVFTGFINERDLPDVYRSASVFCLVGDRGPKRGEGVPLTPLEAAACGVPILVGNQDGSREIVEQGANGFALDPFDLDNIHRHLLLLFEDKELRRKMGSAARLRVEREHAYPVFRERMWHFLASIAQTPREEAM